MQNRAMSYAACVCGILLFLSPAIGAQQLITGAPLSIPPILEESSVAGSATNTGNESAVENERVFDLTVNEGSREFVRGVQSQTLGYNGKYLGPTIRVRREDNVRLRVFNRLGEATTVHWHGAHLPAKADGGPHQRVPAGETWEARFRVEQEAATLWYHPHLKGTTAEQVYQGLAGMFIIDDEHSDSLTLPHDYGTDDIPLILQERRFTRDGRIDYSPRMPDIMRGYFGNALLTNGAAEPNLEVSQELLRLRVLNGSNSSLLRLFVDNGMKMQQIATDGGLLSRPSEVEQVVLSPGERAEIVLDLRGLEGTQPRLMAESNGGNTYNALTLQVARTLQRSEELPTTLVSRKTPSATNAVRTREFVMSSMGPGGRLTINGRTMDMSRIDEQVKLGTTEVWRISSRGMMMAMPHNFHVHGLQFEVLSINGDRPPAHLRGPKDTVLLYPGDTVEILLTFENYTGIFMYHCHLLEHEDEGMMGQFEVLP